MFNHTLSPAWRALLFGLLMFTAAQNKGCSDQPEPRIERVAP